LNNALDYVAACIAAGDESLLPIFERLDAELEAVLAKQSTKDKALARVMRASANPVAQPAA
jgi:hypothetical protein